MFVKFKCIMYINLITAFREVSWFLVILEVIVLPIRNKRFRLLYIE